MAINCRYDRCARFGPGAGKRDSSLKVVLELAEQEIIPWRWLTRHRKARADL